MIRKSFFILFILLNSLILVSCQSADNGAKEQTKNTQLVSLTAEQKIVNIRGELSSVKKELADDGKYNCCIHPACNWCLLHEGSCDCYDNLKQGEEVCPGCGLGWHNGDGVVKGITAKQVKWDIKHEHEKGEHEHDEGGHAHDDSDDAHDH